MIFDKKYNPQRKKWVNTNEKQTSLNMFLLEEFDIMSSKLEVTDTKCVRYENKYTEKRLKILQDAS